MTIDLARTRDLSPGEEAALPAPVAGASPAGAGGLPREQAEYWRAALADAPEPLELPADRARPAQPDPATGRVPLALDEELAAGLRALGDRHGTTLSTALLAGWAVVLGRLSGRTDLVIGTAAAGAVEGLPVRVDLSGSPTAAELLARVDARVRGALRNADLPLAGMAELLQPNGAAPSGAPLFPAAFAWGDACSAATRRTDAPDLSLELREEGGRVAGGVVFATALFDRETVERYAGYLRRVLAGMAADETGRVDRLALLPDEERHRVVEAWNRTEAPYPDAFIHERFEAQAARTPDAVAVVYEDRRLTYGELNGRANRLAHHLRALGVGPDVRVAICAERGPELVVAVLGVLKSGGAYLPLDPGYPRERLLDMVQDSAPVAVLAHGGLAERLAVLDLPVVRLDEEAAWGAGQPATNPARGGLDPENLTYVIYTSGSTGRPKGVQMTHRGASNLLHWYLGAAGMSEHDAVLVVTSFSFHLTQRNLMAPLFVGGRLHLAREPFEPGRIAAQIVASGITMMNLTPTGFQALVEADGGRAIGGLRIVVFGGEPLYPRQLARVPEPRPRFLNPYGSTEATGITTHHFARADLASYPERSMPPGRPIANASIYVLDPAGEPVPVGVAGELYLGGAGVTRGYRGRPGHTAERYVPDPFGRAPGARLYRTGDLGRWLPDGTIEFMGRGDAQVKVRGFRIELGEIEARLAEHPAVREGVVVARDGEAGDPRLVAYHVGDEVRPQALRAFLAERLPDYMVPAAFVALDALPVNPNGKLDRRALPAPDFAWDDEEYVAPRTPVEAELAGIWAEVLGLERAGVEDGFFDRGGHSLLATRLVFRVREAFGVELPLRALFDAPTVAGVARHVEALRAAGAPGGAAGAGDGVPPLQAVPRDAPLPLSLVQEHLWLSQQRVGGHHPEFSASVRLRGTLCVPALRRALDEVARRHEPLRTVFRLEGARPVQVVLPPAPVPLPVVDLTGLPSAARARAAARVEAIARRFDLERGPLFTLTLVRTDADAWRLLYARHHLVGDRWSSDLLMRELSALYNAFAAGRPSPLPALPLGYGDWAAWQRRVAAGPTGERELAWWRERLDGAAAPALPAAGGTPGGRASAALTLDGPLLAWLRATEREEGCTLFVVLLAAVKAVLARHTGQTDLCVFTPVAGRTRPETAPLIGYFSSQVLLRTELGGNVPFRALLRRVRETVLEALARQELPFVERPELTGAEAARVASLCRFAYTCAPAEAPSLALEGVAAELAAWGEGEAQGYDTISFVDRGERVDGTFTVRGGMYDPAFPGEWVRHVSVLLAAAAAHPERGIFDLPLDDAAGAPAAPAAAVAAHDEADFAF